MADVLDFDELKMYFGEDIEINEHIKIHMPRVGEVVEYGEREYYSMVYSLTAIPSDMKSRLFDMGIDYEELSDFELFYMLTRTITQEQSEIFFYDLDISKMEMYKDPTNDEFVMAYPDDFSVRIDLKSYNKLVGCIRKLHSIVPKVEKAGNAATKKILIEVDRRKAKKAEKEQYTSTLLPLVSAMMRYPGFKYKSSELKECTLFEFMDTVQGAQIFVQSKALLQGSYSGMIDTSKIPKKEFNWMRRLGDDK